MKKLVFMTAGAMLIAAVAFAQVPDQNQNQGSFPQQQNQNQTFPQQDQQPVTTPQQDQPAVPTPQQDQQAVPGQDQNNSLFPQQQDQKGLFPEQPKDTTVPDNAQPTDTSGLSVPSDSSDAAEDSSNAYPPQNH